MDQQLFKILKRVYFKKKFEKDDKGYLYEIDNGDIFDSKKEITIYSVSNLNPIERQILEASNYPVNSIKHLSHDECIQEFHDLANDERISLNDYLNAFVSGFDSFPRGRQPILSWLFAKKLPLHHHEDQKPCPICSIKGSQWVQLGEVIFRLYDGYAWNEIWPPHVIDLKEFKTLKLPTPTKRDIEIFQLLIKEIKEAKPNETVSQLEQRIRKAKIIPHYEKYRFRGQLTVLAELGILPNPHIKPLYDGFTDFSERVKMAECLHGNARSDVILPLAGWNGSNPIDEKRLYALFPRYL